MKIAIGSDHAGFTLKEFLKKYLVENGFQVKDFGTFSKDPVDYPEIAIPLAKSVGSKQIPRGVLICGTGVGVAVAANRVEGVRAVNAYDLYTAKQSREHGDSNVLCLGGRTLRRDKALKILKVWLETPFSNEERHIRRLNLLEKIPAAIPAIRKFYIDTSVPNYILAEREPEHVFASRRFFKLIKQRRLKAFISTVVVQEIGQAPREKRAKLLNLVKNIEELKVDKKAEQLAWAYIKNKVIPAKYFNDALHVAVAVVNRIDCLVSWNFKHLINVKAKEKINHWNYKLGFSYIDLVTPEEVLG